MKSQRITSSVDPWHDIQANTSRHRAEHGCWPYPHADGRLLGVLAATTGARRILELGTTLGYTALWLACGAPVAAVDTQERDPRHVTLARAAIDRAGHACRVIVHHGKFSTPLPKLRPSYDLAFFDGYAPTLDDLVDLRRLLRSGGLLISANQHLAGVQTCGYRKHLLDSDCLLTAPLDDGGDVSLSIRCFDSWHQ